MNFDAIHNEHCGSAAKLLSDNRDAYIMQSANTRNGIVPSPKPPHVSEYEFNEAMDGRYPDNY